MTEFCLGVTNSRKLTDRTKQSRCGPWYSIFKKGSARNDISFRPTFRTPVLRLFADHAHGLRTARNSSSQLKSLRFKTKSESRGVLRQKLHLAGCTIIVGAGRGGLTKWLYGRTYRVPVPGTRYLLCTVKRTIL